MLRCIGCLELVDLSIHTAGFHVKTHEIAHVGLGLMDFAPTFAGVVSFDDCKYACPASDWEFIMNLPEDPYVGLEVYSA